MLKYSFPNPIPQVPEAYQEEVLNIHRKYFGKRCNQLYDMKTLGHDDVQLLSKIAGFSDDIIVHGQYIRTFGLVQHIDNHKDHTIIVISKHENFVFAGYVDDEAFMIIPQKFDVIRFSADKLHSLSKLMSYKTPFECYVLNTRYLSKEI